MSEACAGRPRPKLVVLTGGPGAGKTAVLEIVRRHLPRHVVVLREAATIVFGGGFPRGSSTAARRAAQRAIFHVELELETMAMEEGDACVVLCDRGTVDGAAYWPDAPGTFYGAFGTTRDEQLARYATVIHLHPPPANGGYDHSNGVRCESAEDAARIDERIAAAWAGHPRRFFVDHEADFLVKAAHALDLLRLELSDLGASARRAPEPHAARASARPAPP